MSYWVASEICTVENVRQRGALIEKFIEVAKVRRCRMSGSLYYTRKQIVFYQKRNLVSYSTS